jgi:phosphoglycerol transferase MdoB-like AlkP superfamily enzyme
MKNFKLTFILALPFLLISSFTRIILACYAIKNDQLSILDIKFDIFYYGIINDVIALLYIIIFLLMLNIIINIRNKNIIYLLYFFWIFTWIFNLAAEYLFWDEFATRYNFIAVDYLVYTKEVIGNIVESYPLILIFSSIGIVSLALFNGLLPILKKSIIIFNNRKKNIVQLIVISVFAISSFYYFHGTKNCSDRYSTELSKNGIYELFSAFRNNDLDYNIFYPNLAIENSLKILKNQLSAKSDKWDDITRQITFNTKPKPYNVIFIMVESLSRKFLADKELTPNLNNLSEDSLSFSNFYATGTRTVRGIEASILSIPPTPGNSIVRRKNNDNLFSIATILKPNDYNLKFIYGGYGNFDNMNQFFSSNGFNIIDRSYIDRVNFSNIWGVSDGDLFDQVIRESDISFKNNEKFFSFVLTTSNHRPFTYPDGKIDIASGEGRNGGVKYTDYAIGEFIKNAKSKAWFDNTIIIITADHCASSAGKSDIPIEKYHIPLIIYSPKIIKPAVINKISSQIDIAPTILGLLNISYKTRFFGEDTFTSAKNRAFMGTYQQLAYLEDDKLTIIAPKKPASFFKIINNQSIPSIYDEIMFNKIIAYYQGADYLFNNNLLKNDKY